MNTREQKEAVLVSIGEVRGSAGLKPLRTLVDRLTDEYPRRMYSNLQHLEANDFPESSLTRVASVNGMIAGVLSGESIASKFKGEYLFVDPKYSRYNVGEKLIRSIYADHTEFILDPVPLSYRPEFDADRLDVREEALRKYYSRLGFKNVPSSRRMIWKK